MPRSTLKIAAMQWWEKAGAVEQSKLAGEPLPCRSSQVERLRTECVAHVARGDATPFVRRPRPANSERDDVFPSDAFSTATGKDTISGRMASLTGSFRGDAALTAPGSGTVSLEVAAGCLPRQFTDHLGGVWRRALNPIEDAATDATPVYMGISATGTL
ncbi:putative protein kinase, partial [Trypanosoma rangeli]